jgi:hypothetical protein
MIYLHAEKEAGWCQDVVAKRRLLEVIATAFCRP